MYLHLSNPIAKYKWLFFKNFYSSPSLELLIPVQIDQSDWQEISHIHVKNWRLFKSFTPSPSSELLIPVQINQSNRQEISQFTHTHTRVLSLSSSGPSGNLFTLRNGCIYLQVHSGNVHLERLWYSCSMPRGIVVEFNQHLQAVSPSCAKLLIFQCY